MEMRKHQMMDKIIQYQMRKISTFQVSKFLDEYTEELRQSPFTFRCFMVFNPIGEDWEQMSIAFKTFEEAKSYYDRQDKSKYPYLRIFTELSYNGS